MQSLSDSEFKEVFPQKVPGFQQMKLTIETAISAFGVAAKAKLANPAATGQPEDQIRAPFEQLLFDIATLSGFPSGSVVAVGESSVSDLKTRPDYAVTVQKSLVGFVELKAPGKGCDPRKFGSWQESGKIFVLRGF
jgi:hypothetical protein